MNPQWTMVEDGLPDSPRCVLATDGELHFVAVWHEEEWSDAHADEAIDSHIVAWMELPEVPEV